LQRYAYRKKVGIVK